MVLCLLLCLLFSLVSGRPPLPPLPMEDGCLLVSPEVELFRLEGEPVILSFPQFHSVLKDHRMSVSGATPIISKTNGTNNSAPPEGRVQQRGAQLWLLPALEEDSGHYTCMYRNETFCVRGGLTLQVYSSQSVHIDKLIYNIEASEGERLFFRCPSLSRFNWTDTQVHWDKVPGPPGLSSGLDPVFGTVRGRLLIPEVKRVHSGLYKCVVTVVLEQQNFRVSRAVLLTVQEIPQETTSDLPVTSDLSSSTNTPPEMRPPVIISPLNGSVFESSHGSGLELYCTVLTDCPTAESTQVTWLVDGQSVESSYMDGRALDGGRRVSRLSGGCHVEVRLMIVEVKEKDTEAELKCVTQNQRGHQEVKVRLQLEDLTSTWLVVGAVALSCLLTVVSVFLCVLLKPKHKSRLDYTLARQNSTF